MKMKKLDHLDAETKRLKTGKLIAIASTPAVDRVGDSIDQKDWDLAKFKANPVLQAGHDYRPQYTVGIAKDIHIDEKGNLVFEPVFHTETKLAKSIKAMYESEPPMLKAWSVGFIPNAMKSKSNGQKVGKNELLEISAVAVPANSEALTYAKSYGRSEGLKALMAVSKLLGDDTLIDEEDGEEMEAGAADATPDDELIEGETCITSSGAKGTAVMEGEVLICKITDNKEEEKKEMTEGDVCVLPDGTDGYLCMHSDSGKMVCMPKVGDVKEGEDKEEEKSVEKDVDLEEDNNVIEEGDISETVSDELTIQENRKKKWKNLDMFDKIVYAFYSVYMNNDTAPEDFGKLVSEVAGLLSELATGNTEDVSKNYKGEMLKSFDGGIADIFEISLKEGRVLSTKNVELLTECVGILKQASTALDNILTSTAPKAKELDKTQENADLKEDVKGREKAKVSVNHPAKNADKIVLRALQQIAGLSNKAIHEKKKDK
jgi:hypothetical protein